MVLLTTTTITLDVQGAGFQAIKGTTLAIAPVSVPVRSTDIYT